MRNHAKKKKKSWEKAFKYYFSREYVLTYKKKKKSMDKTN